MEYKVKSVIFSIITIIIFLIFTIKLFSLQIISNYIYVIKSSKNLEVNEYIIPLRGEIKDRNGELLAKNIPSFNIFIIKKKNNINYILNQLIFLSKITDFNIEDIVSKFNKSYLNQKIYLKYQIDKETLTKILENYFLFPDINWENSFIRFYPYGENYFHTIGYIGEIDEKELKLLSGKDYKFGDLIGKIGLEKYYDEYLKGIKGIKIIKTNAKGEIIEEIIKEEPIAGDTLILSFDNRIQNAAKILLENYRGSVIVQNIKTGEIIAMASNPSIDPNLFVKGISKKKFQDILNNPDTPLLFRAISSEYPASSIYKLLIAIGILNEKSMNPYDKILCTGQTQLGNRIFKCHSIHGYENLFSGIKDSCNVYFYNAASRLGINNIIKYSKLFGFGELTEIDIFGEKSGFIPTPEWKLDKIGEPWFEGDTYNIGIGQGYLLCTVLQINMFTSIIANKGINYKPHFLIRFIDPKTKQIKINYIPQIFKKVDLPDDVWNFIINAMIEVVKTGTAWWGATTSKVEIAGKTGTAQNLGEDHSWFSCFGPVENPQYAITVMLENAGFGSAHAAPIAAILFDMLYSDKSLEEIKKDIEIARYKKYLNRGNKKND
ncbi:MAG: penicillin-binding protein 2 [Spirochaetes bacterium]|nr:penicillin-binding protein 2 [Spirochaetota bacterium]